MPDGPRVSIQLELKRTSYDELRATWSACEDLGFDTVYLWDHLFPIFSEDSEPSFECWALFGALAESTKRVRLGALVSGNTYRNPAIVAKMATTLDHVSHGRFVMGVGAGWHEAEHRAFGVPFPATGDRLRGLEDALIIMRSMFGPDDPTSHAGQFHRTDGVWNQPKPVQHRLPILVGGAGERVTLRLAAQYADAWNCWGNAESWGRLNRLLDEWCDRVGRPRSEVERSVMLEPKQFGEAEALVNAGAQEVVLIVGHPWDLSPAEAVLHRLAP